MTNSRHGKEAATGSGHCLGQLTVAGWEIVAGGMRRGVGCAEAGWAEDHDRNSGEGEMDATDAVCYIDWAGHSWEEAGCGIVVNRDLAGAGHGRCIGDAGEQMIRALEAARRWKSIDGLDEQTVADSIAKDEKGEAFGSNSEVPRPASIRSFAPPRDGQREIGALTAHWARLPVQARHVCTIKHVRDRILFESILSGASTHAGSASGL